jgi:hypothetical protein
MTRICCFMLLLLVACGGAISQSADCKKWVACADALPGAVKGAQDAAYGPAGTCWTSTSSPDIPRQCTTVCRDAVAAQAVQPNAPAECR